MITKSLRSVLVVCLIINAICGNAQTDNVGMACPPGYQYVNGLCYSSSSCPEGYYLNVDGKCNPQTNVKCPAGYFLSTDNLCYRTNPLPCPFETTTTTTTEPTTTTTELTTTTTEPTTTTTEPTTTTTTEPTTTTTTEPTTTTTTTTTTEPTTTTTTTTTTEPTTTTTTTTTTEPTTTTTTTSTTEPPTTTTEPLPPVLPPEELGRCPPGSLFFDSQCRKIVCSEGEYYAGRCISSACPPGTVWFGKRCQEPGYITTILEIGNVIHNEHKYAVTSENINRVEYITAAPYDPDKDKSYDFSTPESVPDNIVAPATTTTTTTRRPWIYPTWSPTTEQSVINEAFPGRNPPSGCCFVKSPRICINYAPNWVCSSKEKKFCDTRVCTAPVVYLKPPKIVHGENPKRVVMPPNPPLLACSTPQCKESEVLDCSGCKDNQRDKCSPGCYSYYCPNGSCAFMNTQDFCEIYPGEFGCNPKDGCIWDWCTKKCY
ncbi:mucin-2 [Drosophila eugracilis]|uniref:mucin-2 n=1 Tax=Drosophila eugracilis TaxID=29029 RepID=UPI001BDA086F|nr:mucin-2 [Drosophila eugracilis]